jgi:hypothetical protein
MLGIRFAHSHGVGGMKLSRTFMILIILLLVPGCALAPIDLDADGVGVKAI